ncbi:hypothetical protein ICJ04_00750 [Stenotrophomonas sp. 169]|uniref:hypothetical protein n=1 Tax=Stenotrophomonas sp. 169 TaxID=2770322 RepID=UPI00166259C5|nr:hypothetical protein [Stenotrophomonas sp. 169]QNR97489.1 hypothetical protein ICJ04_00750 [Stenotrophomonas sp. 169]
MIDPILGVIDDAYRTKSSDYMGRLDGGIYTSFSQVPSELRNQIKGGRIGDGKYDFAGLLDKGKQWLIEPLRQLQPNSYVALQEVAGPLLLGIAMTAQRFKPDELTDPFPVLFMESAGSILQIYPPFQGETYEGGDDSFGSLLSLPSAISKSWLWRCDGWRLPLHTVEGPMVNRGLVGHPSFMWVPFDQYLDSAGRGVKKKYLEKYVTVLPDMVTYPNGTPAYKLRCFLDTRPRGYGGTSGDQLFVCSTRTDQIVYHIRNGDLDCLRVIDNPAESIDLYCAHVIRALPGRFDFMPWSRPFADMT